MHADLLRDLRRDRAFDASIWLRAKSILLNSYLRDSSVHACVVGVSGGIDSAVTLGTLVHASKMRGSPIKRIVAVLAPVDTEGATNQEGALARGRHVAEHFGAEVVTVPLAAAHVEIRKSVETALEVTGNAWARGQLVSTIRTPALYYLATLTEGIVVGTTNRDEGGYIGFFGKASDGMVDLQLISDLHKSEVRQVAELLGVPDEVMRAVPSGDVFDGRTDEQMIGTSYDMVELFTLLRCAGRSTDSLGGAHETIEALHRVNAHKYIGAAAAIHIDVYERAVPGGWTIDRAAQARVGPFIGEHVLPKSLLDVTHATTRELIADCGDSAFVVRAVLDAKEALRFWEEITSHASVPVGTNGIDLNPTVLGSHRSTAYDDNLARALWSRLRSHVPTVRFMDPYTPTDHDEHPVYRAVGISPLFRFIRYPDGGFLVPHHDSTYEFGDGRCTLMSVVIAITNATTRLLHDRDRYLPRRERTYEDASEPASSAEVLADVALASGDALLLDHRMPHDVAPHHGQDRITIRADIVFERCGLPTPNPQPPTPNPQPQPPTTAAHPQPQPLLDPYYKSAASLGVDPASAAWFDDGLVGEDPRSAPQWLATPLYKAIERLRTAKPTGDLVVLVSTGAFCPVHEGHIAIMEAARRALEAQGASVLGGYLSPSHDSYVGPKCGPGAPDAATRVALAEEAVAGSDWLMVDPWESLHTRAAINFTDVIERLARYLASHVKTHRPIHVAYVFGADNARFALAFAARGRAVCVARPGHEDTMATFENHPLCASDRILFVHPEIVSPASSTAIRKRGMPRRTHDGPPKICLRDEGSWVGFDQSAFVRGLIDALAVDVEVRSLGSEKRPAEKTISLDPCIETEANVGISRLFELACDVSRDFIARPGWPPLDEQLRKIPGGDYVLFDDDIATGRTLEAIKELLPADVRITRADTASSLDKRNSAIEICDARDFLPGARDGGLVVVLFDGTVARAPYLLPYVRPSARVASLSVSREVEFSRVVWGLAAQLFASSDKRVKDMTPAFGPLAHAAGFHDDTSMLKLCVWHRMRLE